jgi:uncharacterized protein (TIGR00297 family)
MHLISLELTLIWASWWVHTPLRIVVILAITVAFAALGTLVRGVTRSGAVAGGVVCFVLFATAGPGGFAALLSVFAVTWLATRFGLASKQRMGTAERGEGRTASQVLANLGVAALAAVIYSLWNDSRMLLAMSAGLAEAAADTVSSECGQAFSDRAHLITTFERVPAGTDGGITLAGTLAGMVAAFVVSSTCALAGLVPRMWIWSAGAAGVVGMLADSYLGAWLERRGWLGNDIVNLIGTGVAAAVALLSLRLFS